MSWIVKLGKKGKKIVKKIITPAEKHYVGYTRRIERVKTGERICAMTFDDGPMGLPASPDRFEGKTLTDVLLDTLAQYGAKGSFDVIGDTSENYPDEAGKLGSAAWGGVKFDHYPDIHCDDKGGAVHNDRLIRRMLDEGHQITNHGYRHIIFGKKPFVYGAREYLPGFDAAVADLTRLDTLMRERYGYTLTLARPPHYVDKMAGGFTSYDVYERIGYQYMAASFDGAGWLPSSAEMGAPGNCVIFGHRMKKYGRHFNRLDELEAGDEINLSAGDGDVYTYTVTGKETIEPEELFNALSSHNDGYSLTLVTCTPVGKGTHRLLIYAAMQS